MLNYKLADKGEADLQREEKSAWGGQKEEVKK
jgi:hypothetical protein